MSSKVNKKFKLIKRIWLVCILIVIAIISILTDIFIGSQSKVYSKLNEILFTAVTVIAGFWVTCYLLFFQLYKDRYPLKFIKDRYLPQMKCNFIYIIFSITFGCFVITKNGGVCENVLFAAIALFTVLLVLKYTYDTSKSIMINTYIDEFCEEMSKKLNNKENCVNNDAFKDLKYILDESIVREEYFIVQNIAIKTGIIFRTFLSNSISILQSGDTKECIEKSFDNIVNISIYQLKICKDVSSDLIITDVGNQQIFNINFCIDTNQYEWFKKYIKEINLFAFESQKNNNKNLNDEVFSIFNTVLKNLINEEKSEWIKYLVNNLFSMATSLNFIDENINLKYFASTLIKGLIICNEEKKEEYFNFIYEKLESFTNIVCKIPKGFSDVKVYYALYFNEIIKKDIDQVYRFLKTIFENGQNSGNDSAWTEFKFYCVIETIDYNKRVKNAPAKILREYHMSLLSEVIEMKERYKGYMIEPDLEKEIMENQYSIEQVTNICSDIRFLLNKTIINPEIFMTITNG